MLGPHDSSQHDNKSSTTNDVHGSSASEEDSNKTVEVEATREGSELLRDKHIDKEGKERIPDEEIDDGGVLCF